MLGKRVAHASRAAAAVVPRLRGDTRAALVFAVAIGAAVRLQVLTAVPPILRYDSVDYLSAAQQLAATGHYSDPQLAPLYPMLLGVLFRLFGHNHLPLLFVQHLVDLGSVALVFLIARETLGMKWAPVIASLAVALDFALAQYANMVLTESLFFFCVNLVALAFVVAYRRRTPLHFVLLALAIVLAQLVRPVAALMILCVPVGLLLAGWGLRRLARPSAIAIAAWLAVTLGAHLLLPTPGSTVGIMLYYRVVNIAHLTAPSSSSFGIVAPYAEGGDAGYGVVLSGLMSHEGMSRAAADRAMRRAAVAAIKAHPVEFLAAQGRSAFYLFDRSYIDKFHSTRWMDIDYYSQQLTRYGTPELLSVFPVYGDPAYSSLMVARVQRVGALLDGVICPLFLVSLIGYVWAHRRRPRPLLILVTLVAYLAAVTITFNAPLARYRSAFDSLAYVTIAYGLAASAAYASRMTARRPAPHRDSSEARPAVLSRQ